MVQLTCDPSRMLSNIAEPYIKRGMSTLIKYTNLFNDTARCESYAMFEIKDNEVYQEPPHGQISGKVFHKLTIVFKIRYTQDVGCSATFKWIEGNEYYGSITESFKHVFGDAYKGFSKPLFIKEDNCYKTNHSQTFETQTTININKELTEQEVKVILEHISYN